MDEHVLAGLALDESEAFAGVKPLHGSLFFQLYSLLYLSYSAPLPTAPSQKKRLQVWTCSPFNGSKGFTRATNAPQPYHVRERFVHAIRRYDCLCADLRVGAGRIWSTCIPPVTTCQSVAFICFHAAEGCYTHSALNSSAVLCGPSGTDLRTPAWSFLRFSRA